MKEIIDLQNSLEIQILKPKRVYQQTSREIYESINQQLDNSPSRLKLDTCFLKF